MLAKFENVTIEEPKGQVSSKDASKFYGSAIMKFKDPETNKKTSLPLRINTIGLVQALEKYEVEESLLNITLEIGINKFDPKTVVIGDIVDLEIVA